MRQTNQEALFDFYGKPGFNQVFPLALQHVVAAIVGIVTPAIIVSGAAGLDNADKVFLIQAALVISGLATLLQLFPLGKKDGFKVGAALPVIMGVSFAYVPSMQAIAGDESGLGIPMILGAQIVGGVVAVIVGFSIKKIRKLFPPLIAGTVVFTIGLSLYPTAVNYMAGGAGKPLAKEVGKLGFGSWQNWTVALLTLVVVTGLNHFAKGIFKLASILIGVLVGYAAALCMGLVDFSGIAAAGYFQLPTPLHFGVVFEPSSCIAIGLLFAINSIQAIGDFSATTTGSMDRMPEDKELQGGIVGYGISNIIGALLGGLPTATYSQNVGIVVTTKVISRVVLGLAALMLLIAGVIPKFSAILTTIPQCVLGGATISVFASIAMTGIKLIMTEEMNYRNTSIVGLSVALGMGVTQAANALASFPDWMTTIFGKSPVVVATCVAILLNLILPKTKDEKTESK
ncbi:uracil-xanthine permease family protein [Faecalicatena sp. AGMB00832]|uniref:Uracil-xanthine permease family protein n=1 Tax=Faecalicatena faecalis TaxID=2726362 RepID=A0ABS6D5K1_9FIRM|nr:MULTISPECIES: nucleobase:cation symporter-2 family protein [Faecalicatena]MBU3876875.1 uracil-xanthine permease family protein [Faecalicatena faecalis]MCI6466141.1 uracil-xanthine permease family protein [Faecalicatena sp.]MDY5619306.1 nucleobase:cation symporter-2 family protein [Lachnospiraceae bacterium]